MRFLGSSKCSKTTGELAFTAQKANACSPWTATTCFRLEVHFLDKFGPKTQNCQLKLEFGT